MIIYQNTKGGFINDIKALIIADKIEDEFKEHHLNHSNLAEYRAWIIWKSKKDLLINE